MTTGIDALDGYYYATCLSCSSPSSSPSRSSASSPAPDWVSAALIAVSLPLIPLFMALVGATTKDHTAARMRSLQKLAGPLLDVVAGCDPQGVRAGEARPIDRRGHRPLPLGPHGDAAADLPLLADTGAAGDRAVALVAWLSGLRLLGGHITFEDALFVLVLAPEAYLPLRALGANYHASADGMKAAEEIFELLESPKAARWAGRRAGGARPSHSHRARRDLSRAAAHTARCLGRQAGRNRGADRPGRRCGN